MPGAIAFLGASGAAQFRERRLELAILFVLRAEGVEHLARILRRGDGVEDVCRLGRGLRQLDIAADAGIGETAGLHMTGIGEHGLRELEIGFRQRLGREAGKSRDLVVAHLEPVGIGVLQPSDGGDGARILDSFIEPNRRVVAALVEPLGRGALLLAGKNSIRGRGEEIADLFRKRAVGWIERGQRVNGDRRLRQRRVGRRCFGRLLLRRCCGGGQRRCLVGSLGKAPRRYGGENQREGRPCQDVVVAKASHKTFSPRSEVLIPRERAR